MAGFNAANVVERLDWDFTAFVPDAKGTVPEPSTDKVGAFFDQLHTILDRPQDESVESIVQFMAQVSSNQLLMADEKLLAAYADLCGDSPTIEQLRALPHRQRQAFFGWITGQVTDPT